MGNVTEDKERVEERKIRDDTELRRDWREPGRSEEVVAGAERKGSSGGSQEEGAEGVRRR